MYTRQEKDGSWKCGDCMIFEIQQKIVRITPNSERAHEILEELEEENRQVQRWNKHVARD